MRLAPTVLVLLAVSPAALAQDWAPFVIPMTPNPKSLVALESPPVPADGPRLVARDGHFFVGRRRVRIWGVNTCFGASFPTHADAERMADRLAAGGVNGVRFHHMDTATWPSGILDPQDPSRLHPEALDRLDYLIDQLARRGIYANVNLHVGAAPHRWLKLPDPGTDFDKIAGIFTPALIDAQKKYARDLLGRTNAYRKVRYADDPAVAFVEITNEDSLFMWDAAQRLPALPEFYAKILGGRFADWLKARYGTTEKLRAAWAQGVEPLGDSLLVDADFALPEAADPKAQNWYLEQHEGSAARLAHPADAPKAVRIEIAKADATNWHLQFGQMPLALKEGQYYTVTFRARADAPRAMGYGVGQAHEPWGSLGLSGGANLTKEWQTFRAGFKATASDDRGRLAFVIGASTVAVDLAEIALRPGGREGLRPGESLEAGVALWGQGEVEARSADRMRFLATAEKAYFEQMRDVVRKDLGSKALVTGTIVFGPLGLYGQSGMDYVDSHSYWQHPQFPGRAWDPADWIVEQSAMVDHPEGATLWRIASERLEKKPFTLSEYNHSAPNDYQAECVPMLAAFAAAQDWDGIWLFAYSHRTNAFDRGHFDSFFDMDANPAKWGFMQAGAALFREGALPPLRRAFSVSLGGSENDWLDQVAALHAKHGLNLFAAANERMELAWQDLLRMRLEAALSGHTGSVDSEADVEPALAWAVKDGKGTFSATGPGAIVVVTHGGGAEGVEVTSPGFAAVTVTSLDGKPFAKSRAVLVAACGRAENTDMQFSADRRTVGRNWGKDPVRIEAVTGRVALPAGTWRCQALGPDGTAAADVELAKDAKGRPVLEMSPRHRTMWYLLVPAK